MRFSLRARFLLVGFAIAAALAACAGAALWALDRVKIGGPIYTHIVDGKDLIADILPPPAYAIEGHLVCLQMLGAERDELDGLAKRAEQLEADFTTRMDHWLERLPADPLRRTLTQDARAPAEEFFRLRRTAFLPALRQGRVDEARSLAFGAMRQAYERHRGAIDSVVAAANADLAYDEEQARHTLSIAYTGVIAALVVAAVLVAIALVLAARSTSQAVARTTEVLVAMSDGQQERRLADTGIPDFDRLAQAVNRIVDGLSRQLAEVGRQTDQLHAAATRIRATGGEVRGTVEDTTRLAQDASTAAGQVVEVAHSVAERTSQLATTALEITRRVDQASRQTTEVQNAFAEACRLVDELRAAGNQIGEVALSISQLTSQVNLLALNATIEASRAGEAGRGFAVVAGEVKALAQRTADANAHITERVAAVRAATLACSQALARATDGVQSMAEDQQGIAAAVEEQSASTEEIRVHADAAAQLSQAIVTSVAGVTGAAGRAEKAVKKTDAAASELNGVASALRSTFAPAST